MTDNDELKRLCLSHQPAFWEALDESTRAASGFDQLFRLSALRKKAHGRNLVRAGVVHERVRLAIVGGYSFFPLREIIEHVCEMERHPVELWIGDYDNYIAEIMDESSGLYEFKPQVVLVMPSEHRCRYSGRLTDARALQEKEAGDIVASLHGLARRLHEQLHAEVILTNFMLPARHDLGGYRARTLGSDWSFRKWVNLEVGLGAPPYLHICDMEFLANRQGGTRARDERAWFETKQPCSPELLLDLAREVSHLIVGLRRPPKKVLVLDLDNTLWGGVVADDGLEGIEVGDTSPLGEAFKAFQRYIASLKERGILLAVASKNDHDKAEAVFLKHPEMVLRLDDFVSFRASWDPKSESLRQMAADLNLGLDSFVFVDDNPAEIEIVRQFAPEVATIELGPDPSTYVAQLQDCRLFEPRNITAEDAERTRQYQSEARRKEVLGAITDMDSYWGSLGMVGEISEFTPVDIPRLAQLINKSNQFNLTTRRRTEADLHLLLADPDYACFSFRLSDRFGDHGLVSIVIGKRDAEVMTVDTWVMSCRVLKRQVEDEVLNELVRLARGQGCTKLVGLYLPTPKNGMVRDFLERMGLELAHEDEKSRTFKLGLEAYQPHPTKIAIQRRARAS